jgi:hypothetical protein
MKVTSGIVKVHLTRKLVPPDLANDDEEVGAMEREY